MRRLRVGLVVLMALTLLASAAVAVAGNGRTPPGWNGNSHKYTAAPVTNPITGEVSRRLVREKTPDAVLAQHMKALNTCDWKGLMQQYPDSYELRDVGALIKGRTEAAATFAGFVSLTPAEGGLCGIQFTEISRQVTGGTIAVLWEANAPFLAEPYRGSDAYITDDGLMVSMVSTFDGAELKFKP
ncbi:MAG: nuclear transport factor 2 family protein [Candidatus Limnocylindrales bacterium]